MVYKLVDINGVAKIKLSDEKEKTTLPGEKLVLRIYDDASSKPAFDLLCLATELDELITAKSLTVFDTFGKEPTLRDFTPSKIENLSELLFSDGAIQKEVGKLSERRLACMEEFKSFGGADALLGEDAHDYNVYLSEKLNTLANSLLEKYHR